MTVATPLALNMSVAQDVQHVISSNLGCSCHVNTQIFGEEVKTMFGLNSTQVNNFVGCDAILVYCQPVNLLTG